MHGDLKTDGCKPITRRSPFSRSRCEHAIAPMDSLSSSVSASSWTRVNCKFKALPTLVGHLDVVRRREAHQFLLPRLSSSPLSSFAYAPARRRRRSAAILVICNSSTSGQQGADQDPERREAEDVDEALNLDEGIPSTSNEFVKRVSSRAYGMRRQLEQTIRSSSYDGTPLPFLLFQFHAPSFKVVDWGAQHCYRSLSLNPRLALFFSFGR